MLHLLSLFFCNTIFLSQSQGIHLKSIWTPNFRGDEKVQFLKSLGVDYAVDLGKGNIIESVKNFLKSRNLKGVDVLYDPVGGKLTKESMKLLNWGANILIIGFASGEVPVIPANIALVKVAIIDYLHELDMDGHIFFMDLLFIVIVCSRWCIFLRFNYTFWCLVNFYYLLVIMIEFLVANISLNFKPID